MQVCKRDCGGNTDKDDDGQTQYFAISMKDLDGFSDETKEIVERMVR